MPHDVLARSREQLVNFWRSIATIPIANLILALRSLPNDPSTYLHCAVVLLFLGRYSIGNHNYVAATFGTAPAWLPDDADGSRVRKRFAWDVILQGLQLSAMIWMALAVQSPTWFRRGLIALLLADLLFLCFDKHSRPSLALWIDALRRVLFRRSLSGRASSTKEPRHRYAPRIWVLNNFFTGFALIAFDVAVTHFGYTDRGVQATAASVVAIVNSAFDILLTGLDL